MAAHRNNRTPSWLTALTRLRTLAVVLAIVAVLAGAFSLWHAAKGTTLSLTTDDKIDITPVQIASIERIGQWELLSVADEELVDTVRHGLFGDDRLVRIYYGTLRLGIDLSEAPQGWLRTEGDTVVATLPRVRLLDEHFIDEARTRAFIESGKWTEADRAALTAKAYRVMRAHCLTPQTLQSAGQNAETQMARLLRAMGFKHVKIMTTPRNPTNER